jgi:hypothetical protein
LSLISRPRRSRCQLPIVLIHRNFTVDTHILLSPPCSSSSEETHLSFSQPNHRAQPYESRRWYRHSPLYRHPLSSHSTVHPKPLLDHRRLSPDGLLPAQSAMSYISAHIIGRSYVNPPIMPSDTNFVVIGYRDLIVDSRSESQPTYPAQLCQFRRWYQPSRLVPSVPSSRLSVSSSPPRFSSSSCLL